MQATQSYIYLSDRYQRNVYIANNKLELSKLNLSNLLFGILNNRGDFTLTCPQGKHISPNGTPSSSIVVWNIYDENDGYRFVSRGGVLEIGGETIFKIHKYSMKSRIAMVHWGGDHRLTKEDYLYEGAKKVMDMGIRSFKIYLGQKSDKTYFTTFKHTKLHEIVTQPNYKRIFEMGFQTIVIVSHYKTATYWKRLPDDERKKEMENEYKELFAMTQELGSYTKTQFIISNWEGDCIINSDRTSAMYAKMVEWINNRQRAVTDAQCSNVAHAIEVNFVKQSLSGHRSVTTEVLPYTNTDYVSYSCYDAQNEQEFEACIHLIKSKANGRPLYIGEFGTPVNVRTSEQSWAYLNGVVRVMERESIGLGCYWQLYDNEFDDVDFSIVQDLDDSYDKSIIISRGNSHQLCRGFGIINPGKKVTGVWGIINTLW